MGHGQGRQAGGAFGPVHILAGCALVALLLAGCASAEGPSAGISEAALAQGSVESAGVSAGGAEVDPRAAAGQSRAAPAPTGRQKPPEPAYPTFGAPAQVGDRPVLTQQQRDAMQKNLENLASQREKEMLRQIEAPE
ncbi:hypothetical protein [Ancylobacter sp. FA202]|uniref:hypothetical protein n=1 Tax=Ancylobacter sp. FA202 TaxID=1111106 RepID=UPI00037CDD84|nr:hypothetical protein [Ancylobacter sp. FA202]